MLFGLFVNTGIGNYEEEEKQKQASRPDRVEVDVFAYSNSLLPWSSLPLLSE